MPQKSEMVVNSVELGYRWRQNQEAKLWYRTLYFSQFSAASTSATLDDATFPGGTIIEGAYINAQDVFTAGSIMKPGATLVPGTPLNATTPNGAGTVRFTVTTTTANTNALTAGRVDVYMILRSVALGLS